MEEQNERNLRACLMDYWYMRQCAVKSQELALPPDDPDRAKLAEKCRQLTAMQDALGYLPFGRALPEWVRQVMLTESAQLDSGTWLALRRGR